MGQKVSIETIQLCCYSPQVATGNTQNHEHSYVPGKLDLPRWDSCHCLLSLDLPLNNFRQIVSTMSGT